MVADKSLQKRILLELQNHLYDARELQKSMIDIEDLLWQKNQPAGTILELLQPNNPGFSLKVMMTSKGLDICARKGDVVIHTLDSESDIPRREQFMKLIDFIKQEKVTFAPEPGSDFINRIKKAEPGTMVNLNNNISLVCISKEAGVTYFKKQFDGSLESITMKSFTNSEIFSVGGLDSRDINYLYGRIYSTRSSVADVRINPYKENEGMILRKKAEQRAESGTSRKIMFGPLKVSLVKDRDSGCYWFDGSGKRIGSKLIDIMYGWANKVIPEINKKEWLSKDICDGLKKVQSTDYDEWLTEAKFLAKSGRYDILLDSIFSLAKTTENTLSITIDDLEKDEDGNFIASTYAFKETENGRFIYRLQYEDNDRSLWVNDVRQISQKEFMAYLESRFTADIEHVIMQSVAEEKDKALNEYIRNVDINPFGFTQKDINTLSSKAAALLDTLEDISEESSFEEYFKI